MGNRPSHTHKLFANVAQSMVGYHHDDFQPW